MRAIEDLGHMGINAVADSKVAIANVKVPANGEISGIDVILVLKPERIAPKEVSKNAITAIASFAIGPFVWTEKAEEAASFVATAGEDVATMAAVEAIAALVAAFAARFAIPARASLSQMKPVAVWKAHHSTRAVRLRFCLLRESVRREKELSKALEPPSSLEL